MLVAIAVPVVAPVVAPTLNTRSRSAIPAVIATAAIRAAIAWAAIAWAAIGIAPAEALPALHVRPTATRVRPELVLPLAFTGEVTSVRTPPILLAIMATVAARAIPLAAILLRTLEIAGS